MDGSQVNGLDRRTLLRRSVGAAALGGAAIGGAGMLLAASGVTPTKVLAQEASGKLAEVIGRGRLIVGTGTGNPPWHFDDAGTLSGFDIDMARIVAAGLFEDPNAVEFVQEASDARIANLLTDKVDVVFQFMTVNPARAQQVWFTIPYYREGIGFLLAANGKYKTYDELVAGGNAVRVSILQNPGVEELIHSVLPEANVLPLDSQANVIQAVSAGQADAAAVDQSTVRWLNVQQEGTYLDSGFGFQPQTYAAALKPGSELWVRFLDQVLHEAMTGVTFGSYAAAFNKWFGVQLPTPAIGFPLEFAA